MTEADMPLPLPTTVLHGALILRSDGWHWTDTGEVEPRIRTMRLRDLAPSWRCITYGVGGTHVEVPLGWRQEVKDPDVKHVVADLVRERGREADIYAEGTAELLAEALPDAHRLKRKGYLVPIEAWDAALDEQCGVWWDRAHEADILSRAAAVTR